MTFLKKSSLFLQAALLIHFLSFLTFPSDYSDLMFTVLSEILHRNEAGYFVPKRGHFNGNTAAGVFVCPGISLQLSLRVALEHLKHRETQVSDKSYFICSTAPVYCPWKYNHIWICITAPSQIGNWNKCKLVFFFIIISHRVCTARLYLNMNPSRWLLPS